MISNGSLKTIVNDLKKNNKKKESALIILISGTIFFFLTYGYAMYNKIVLHDDAFAQFSLGANYGAGRWFYAILNSLFIHLFGINSNFSIPTVNMYILMICLLVSSCLIADLFAFNGMMELTILNGLLITSPAIIAHTIFMFGIHFDGIAFLFAVVGAYLVVRFRNTMGFIGGVVFLCFSMGIYQGYIIISICIFYIIFVNGILQSRYNNWVKFIRDIGLFLCTIILALALYAIFTWLICSEIMRVNVNYKGMNTLGNVGAQGWLHRFITIYKEFFYPVYSREYFPDTMLYVYYFILGLIAVGIIILLKKRDKRTIGQFFIVIPFFPLVVDLAFIFCEPEFTNVIMYFGLCFVPVFLLFIIAHKEINTVKFFKGVSICVLLFTVVFYLRYANLCYYKAVFLQEETKAYLNSLVTRIQSTEGYHDDYKIAYLNQDEKNDKHRSMPHNFEPVGINMYAFDLEDNINCNWKEQMKLWNGFCPEEVEDICGYESNKEVKKMPHYPDDGSIKIIDNVIVVKF